MLGYLKEKISGAVTKVSEAVRDRFTGGAVKRTLEEDENPEEAGYAAEAYSRPKRLRRDRLANHLTELNGSHSGRTTEQLGTSYTFGLINNIEWTSKPVQGFGASIGSRKQTTHNVVGTTAEDISITVQSTSRYEGGITRLAEVAIAGNSGGVQTAVTVESGQSVSKESTETVHTQSRGSSVALFSRQSVAEVSESAGAMLKMPSGLRRTFLQGKLTAGSISNLNLSLNSSRYSANRSNTAYRPIHDKLFFPSFTPRSRNNSLRSSPASASSSSLNSTIRKCVRMDQKEQYSKLLARFHGGPSSSSTATRERLPSAKPASVPIVDLENDSTSAKEVPKPISSPKIVVNTLEEALARSPLFSKDYIVSLRHRFSSAERERQRILEEERIKSRVLTEYREKFEQAVEERFRRQVILVPPALLEEEEPAVILPEITDEMESVIRNALKAGASKVCDIFDMSITKQDLATLCGLNWLNDQIINCYFTMIMERSKRGGFPSAYCCNTFFYPKLMQSGHSALKRWTRKVDIFAHDFILVPVHLGIHWCAAVISIKEKSIRYYDSMNGSNEAGLKALLQYLQDESLDKKKTKLDVSDWKLECVKSVPQQMNGSDCGVFACKFAEYASRKARFTFTQEDMPYFRKRMIYEIVTKKLIHP